MSSENHELRSDSPVAASVDIFGDRWTLLILRDLLVGDASQFSELGSRESIATNILSERLQRLLDTGLIVRRRDPADGRRWLYAPTTKAVELVPALIEIMLWGTRHTGGKLPKKLLKVAVADKAEFVATMVAKATERSQAAGY